MIKIINNILPIVTIICTAIHFNGYSSERPLVVEGRTWWYATSNAATDDGNSIAIFGIRITGKNHNKPAYYDCEMVDEQGDPVSLSPVAYVTQTGNLVGLGIPEDFPFSGRDDFYGNCYYQFSGLFYESLHHRNQLTANLYDFAMEAGSYYQWPWSWYSYSDGNNQTSEPVKIWIESVWTDDMGRKHFNITDRGDNYYGIEGMGEIIEGIGLVNADFMGNDTVVGGLFIAPCAEQLPPITGLEDVRWPSYVHLRSVIDKDGTVVYGREDYHDPSNVVPVGADNVPSPDSAIYDLHGRRVTNPQPGTVYIRDGRKYVAR